MVSSIKVRKASKRTSSTNSTDINLLVNTETDDVYWEWDRSRIVSALRAEASIGERTAKSIAKSVEERVLSSKISKISTSLIRELVDNELFERGYQKKLEKQTSIGLPKADIEELIFSKSQENSNIAVNNPEAIQHSLSETILKQYSLQEVFSEEVAEAHRTGKIHIHDLGYPTRIYCSSHSLEYIKKYGLDLDNLDSISAPAKHARSLSVHLNTFLSSMQAYYAGALGVAYVNIMYAPYVENMTDEEMYQEAQHLIFQASQNAFTRGGQTLFIDFNIHTGIPGYLKNIKAIGPGGKYTGKTYGEYEDAAIRFTRALLKVWGKGDATGTPMAFPKLDFHINKETFENKEQTAVFEYACKVAAKTGIVYFIFDRDEVTLSACCRLRTTISDNYMIDHPESMRFAGFQNITINLPQCAYRSGKDMDVFYQELEKTFQLCIKAHLDKKKFVTKVMNAPGTPLWQVGRVAKDGRPYVDLEKATYIIGLIGLNEALEHMIGKELHTDDNALWIGIRMISYLYFLAKEATTKYNLKFSLEESPAESASRRLAKIDMYNFPNDVIIRGSVEQDQIYYTNSIHIRPDADVDLLSRIISQAKFHDLIESGAIIHAFVGEKLPSTKSISNIVYKTFKNTNAAQLTISPEFTICRCCSKTIVGLSDSCKHCGAYNMQGIEYGEFADVINKWDKNMLLEKAGG
jgi:anaerobic ribonucleoside-triphosphate reductase